MSDWQTAQSVYITISVTRSPVYITILVTRVTSVYHHISDSSHQCISPYQWQWSPVYITISVTVVTTVYHHISAMVTNRKFSVPSAAAYSFRGQQLQITSTLWSFTTQIGYQFVTPTQLPCPQHSLSIISPPSLYCEGIKWNWISDKTTALKQERDWIIRFNSIHVHKRDESTARRPITEMVFHQNINYRGK